MATTTFTDPVSALTQHGFEVLYLSHARSILTGEFAESLEQLAQVLDREGDMVPDNGFVQGDMEIRKALQKLH